MEYGYWGGDGGQDNSPAVTFTPPKECTEVKRTPLSMWDVSGRNDVQHSRALADKLKKPTMLVILTSFDAVVRFVTVNRSEIA